MQWIFFIFFCSTSNWLNGRGRGREGGIPQHQWTAVPNLPFYSLKEEIVHLPAPWQPVHIESFSQQQEKGYIKEKGHYSVLMLLPKSPGCSLFPSGLMTSYCKHLWLSAWGLSGHGRVFNQCTQQARGSRELRSIGATLKPWWTWVGENCPSFLVPWVKNSEACSI